MLSQLSYAPLNCVFSVYSRSILVCHRILVFVSGSCSRSLPARILSKIHYPAVGAGRFELPTSSLSATRSNQLSYAPNNWTILEATWFLSNGVSRRFLITKNYQTTPHCSDQPPLISAEDRITIGIRLASPQGKMNNSPTDLITPPMSCVRNGQMTRGCRG